MSLAFDIFKDKANFRLAGHARTTLEMPCGRCLEPFTLPDLDGRDRSLSEMLATPLLLVNWSPWCGFCVRIAGELAELKGTLAERGVGLALVTIGDAEDNLEVFREAGLDAPTLLKQEGIDPFQGFGTPAAYYLDADGLARWNRRRNTYVLTVLGVMALLIAALLLWLRGR